MSLKTKRKIKKKKTNFEGVLQRSYVVNIEFFDAPEIDLTTNSTFICGGAMEATFEWTFNGTSIPETGTIVNAVNYGFGIYEVEAYIDATYSAIKSITVSVTDYTVNLSANQELIETILNHCLEEEIVPSYAWYKNIT